MHTLLLLLHTITTNAINSIISDINNIAIVIPTLITIGIVISTSVCTLVGIIDPLVEKLNELIICVSLANDRLTTLINYNDQKLLK